MVQPIRIYNDNFFKYISSILIGVLLTIIGYLVNRNDTRLDLIEKTVYELGELKTDVSYIKNEFKEIKEILKFNYKIP